MKNYLNEQSAGSIIQNTLEIYLTNFKTLFLIYFLPSLPLLFLKAYIVATGQATTTTAIVTDLIGILVMMLLSFPTTVAVSDIILGNRPTVGRSFHCVFSKRVGSLFITYLFLLFITSVGLLMLIVPGILFTIWYMLTLQVALLEHLSGWKAMDRSKELGKEFYLRNLGVIFLTYIIIFSFSFVVGIALYTVFPNYELIQGTKFFEEFFIQTLGAILSPLPLIAPVLIYYDMRARKEAYDIRTLTEDLARE